MDRSAKSRKTPSQDAPRPTKLPLWIPGRDRRARADENTVADDIYTAQQSPITGGKIERGRDTRDNEVASPVEADANAKSYAVTNVGANGTLYLKPSRMPQANPPQTPPAASPSTQMRGASSDITTPRQSDVSALTVRMQSMRAAAADIGIPLPPLSLANNTHSKRRTRSYSFSNASDNVRAPTADSSEFQILINGSDFNARPKSSSDLVSGLLDLRIPHYRIGTPQFSERGTAYMHNSQYNSQYSSTSEDLRSSVFARADYDKLFPAPPGVPSAGFIPSRTPSADFLHPFHAVSSRTPPPPSVRTTLNGITPAIYDRIQANPNDPSLMRYSSEDGRVMAATPARLIVLITSPEFLDYELLSDFFLTYRAFMSSIELLDYLMTRMQWALDKHEDSGRVVRVRTFVALRHWVLNYFIDDFLGDYVLREKLCILVNKQCRSLAIRSDGGGSDLNILAELKKCWRRTCAAHWPTPDAMDAGPSVEIAPGGRGSPAYDAISTASAPFPRSGGWRDSQRPVSQATDISVQTVRRPSGHDVASRTIGSERMSFEMQRASIPASPMSEDSLQVLSCSVPFLRHMVPASLGGGAPKSYPKDKARISQPPRGKPQSRRGRTSHQHKRSGSFSDALRDERTPLPSPKPDSVDIRSLPAITFTGGLVRGLLLQPSPAKLAALAPTTPAFELQDPLSPDTGDESGHHDRPGTKQGMKRMVGDMRRALNSRRPQSGSPTRSMGSDSSGSTYPSIQQHQTDKRKHPAVRQQMYTHDIHDILGAKIEQCYRAISQRSYQEAPDTKQQQPAIPEAEETPQVADFPLKLPAPLNRLDSRVTTGSRSIVIVDDTKSSSPSADAAPSNSRSPVMKPRPLFRSLSGIHGLDEEKLLLDPESSPGRPSTTASRMSRRYSADDRHLHDLLVAPMSWHQSHGEVGLSRYEDRASAQARASSNAYPSGLDMPPIRHQLRRRPGGDLRAAENIHELELLPRAETWRSMSATTDSISTRPPFSGDLTGTHFEGQNFGLSLTPSKVVNPLGRLHSSQPMLNVSKSGHSFLTDPGEDEQSDGVEDALMKLEGRYGSKSESLLSGATRQSGKEDAGGLQWGSLAKELDFGSIAGTSTAPADEIHLSPGTDRQGASIYQISETDVLSGDYQWRSSRASAPSTFTTGTQPPLPELPQNATRFPISEDISAEPSPQSSRFQRERERAQTPMSGSEGKKSGGPPKSPLSQGSFLLDDNESLSEISTDMGESIYNESLAVRSFFWDADDIVPKDRSTGPRVRFPLTPPSTAEALSGKSREGPMSPAMRTKPHELSKPLKEKSSGANLLASPISPQAATSAKKDHPIELSQLGPQARVGTEAVSEVASHTPFVLAFESSVLAEQLTIVEKDALDEISWKDLVQLKWQQRPQKTTNWVEYLQHVEENPQTNGIDIAITRFNLAVKWVVSEVVLTPTIHERALCITKFIHTAMHTLRMRNFASTYQITLALLSTDLARLKGTWTLVPNAEKSMLGRLEKLCQPMRNFANLRTEMERGNIAEEDEGGTGTGCIPFIGLFTHDLVFNAEKPATIKPNHQKAQAAGDDENEPLVNFERYQTAAAIVKGLLRLLEKSSKYIFHPHPEALSRCLWLAALEDAEISARSRVLEKQGG